MRGKRYDAGKRKVFSSGWYVGVIVAVIIIAALVAITLLVVLPTTEEVKEEAPTIVSINYTDGEIGAGANLGLVYFTVEYSNGETAQVALSSMVYEGLDVTTDGVQNVSLSYGGYEDTIAIRVRKVDCILSYSASDGGRIVGDARQSVISGGDADTVWAMPEAGYTFKGWSDGYPEAERKDKSVNESKNLIAMFEKTKFKVTFFYKDGTTNKEEEVVYGEKATDVPDVNDPRMNVYGYTFVGWSVSEADYSHVLRDMNIYPRYEKTATDVTCEATIDKNGSAMGTTDVDKYGGFFEHSDVAAATITAKPQPDRMFLYWEVLNSDGEYVNLGRQSDVGGSRDTTVEIGDNRTQVTFSVRPVGTSSPDDYTVSFYCNDKIDYVTLRAQFSYKTSRVDFINYQNKNTENKEFTLDDVAAEQSLADRLKEVDVGSKIVIESAENVNKGLIKPSDVIGMDFLGWYVQGDETQTLINGAFTVVEPTELVAKWSPKTYALVFEYYDENDVKQRCGGDVLVSYQNTLGSGGGMPAQIPARDRYVFVGWEDAMTHTSVDDTTIVMYHDEYTLEEGSDFSNNIIRILAAWEPVAHELAVTIEGEGQVTLKKGSVSNDVIGTTAIYENAKYTAVFTANEGYQVEYVDWTYRSATGEGGQYYDKTATAVRNFNVSLNERADNTIRVKFVPITYGVTIVNGDAFGNGFITIGDVRVNSDVVRDVTVNAGEDLVVGIEAQNATFAVDKIYVTGAADGQRYTDTLKADYEGAAKLSAELVLRRCQSDITVTVVYASVTCVVTVNQTEFSEGSGLYPVMLTSYAGTVDDDTVPGAQTSYAFGQEVFYRLRAPEDQYISSVLFNGVRNDLYVGASNVVFYDWEVNGVPLGITLLNVDGTYYYCYGEAGSAVFGEEYMYCQRVTDGAVTIFTVVNEAAGEYALYEEGSSGAGAANAAPTVTVRGYLEEVLDVYDRSIFDYTLPKDARITSMKMMVMPTGNVNVSLTFAEIKYDVSVEASDFGTTEYTKDTVMPGESVSFSAIPVTGYTIVGYKINDFLYGIEDITQGAGIEFTLSDVREDKHVEVLYEVITYNIVFENTTILNGDVYVEKVADFGENETIRLDSVGKFVLEYAASAKFIITPGWNLAITKILVDGEERDVDFCALSYAYVNYGVTKSVSIKISVEELAQSFPEDDRYSITYNVSDTVSASVLYGDPDNTIRIIVRDGYHGAIVGFKSTRGGVAYSKNVDLTALTDGVPQTIEAFEVVKTGAKYEFTVANDYFEDALEVSCTTTAEQIAVTATNKTPTGGTISGDGTYSFGREAVITVAAFDGYYISSFAVNGKEISFVNPNWIDRLSPNSDGKYTGGTYKLLVSEPTALSVAFSKFTYRVSLDKASINGTTLFYYNGENGSGRIEEGEELIVSMSADPGYHISRILINGKEVDDYVPYTTVANDNTNHTYTYRGAEGIGVTGDVSVYVVYDINRYSFTYELVNASANFRTESDTGNRLECPDATYAGNNVYTDIAHGDNFSLNIIPGLSKGYYIYSVTIKYSGYMYGSRTRYAGVDFDENGATLWFNRFLWDNNVAGSVGVTADVEMITVVFKKRVFTLEIGQAGEGTVSYVVSNSLSATGAVYLFDGDDAGAAKYEVLNGAIRRERIVEGASVYEPTDIVLTNRDGNWKLYSESENAEYDMYFEYGLRVSLTSTPREGYERTAFVVNGEDRSGNVFGNKYNFNLYRNTTIGVTYEIKTYDVTFRGVAYQANNIVQVAAANVVNYMQAYMTVVDELGQEERVAEIVSGTNTFGLTLTYGTVIKLYVIPNFEGRGAYVETLYEGASPVSLQAFDVTQMVRFGGEDGYRTTDSMSFSATTMVMVYSVNSAVAYRWTVGSTQYGENIVSESRNVVTVDNSSITTAKPSWSQSASFRIVAGTGYSVANLFIRRQSDTVTLSNYPAVEKTYGYVEYYVDKILRDAGGAVQTDERGNVLTYRDTATLLITDELEITEEGITYAYEETRTEMMTEVVYEVIVVINVSAGTVVVRERKKNVENYQESAGEITSGYILMKGLDDAVYTTKDVLTLYGIKEDMSVEACFARDEFTITYNVNELTYLQNLTTDFNTRNTVYPVRNNVTGTVITSRYYDEITVTITPKDGYKLLSGELTVTCLKKEEDGSFTVLKNANGVEQIYTVTLSSTGNGDERTFTFHREGMPAADRYITSYIRVDVDLVVKEYTIATSITRVKAQSDKTGNNTEVKLEVRDMRGDSLIEGNELQADVIFRPGDTIGTLRAQHHGYVQYSFTTTPGYVLESFTINGFTLEELTTSNDALVRAILLRQEISKDSQGGYTYVLRFLVSTTLIRGSVENAWSKSGNNELNAVFTFAPVTYELRVAFYNEETGEYDISEFNSVTGENGANYQDMIDVYIVKSVAHFGSTAIRPVLAEGYRILADNNTTGVYFGTKDGFTVAPENAAGLMESGKYFDKTVQGSESVDLLNFTTANMSNADASCGKTYVYFLFRVGVISYTETVTSKVYYSESASGVALNAYPTAGTVTVRASKGGVAVGDTVSLNDESQYSRSLEYFSIVTIEAQAAAGFAIYGIYEETTDKNGDTVSTPIVSGTNFVSYSVLNGRHVVSVSVRDFSKSQIIGNRRFRVDFKQEAVVTVHVVNPYKYIESNKRYVSYVNVAAYTSEYALTTGVPNASYAVPNTNVSGNLVVERYEFVVYVGNYVKFVVTDTYNGGYPTTYFFDRDLSLTAEDPSVASGAKSVGTTSAGSLVEIPEKEYYLYVETAARIAANRNAVGAVSGSVGGTLTVSGDTYSSSTTAKGAVADFRNEDSYAGKTITLRVTPDDHYVFYQLRIRQINKQRTLSQGFVIYETAEALMWNTITRDDVNETSAIDSMNAKESSGTKLLGVTTSGDVFTFTFWVCGNAEIYVDFYRTYNVTAAVYYTDYVAQALPGAIATLKGKLGQDAYFENGEATPTDPILRKDAMDSVMDHENLRIDSLTDVIFAANATEAELQDICDGILTTPVRQDYGEGTRFERLGYGASLSLTALKPAGDYQFVGWYANDYDMYAYLSTLLPIDESLSERITLTVEEMPSLASGNTEAEEVCIYAVFQPVVDVTVYNEKFYSYETHFNSWDLATVIATYYPFDRRVGSNESSGKIYATQDVSLVRDMAGRTIEQTKNYLMDSRAYAYVGSDGAKWSNLLSSTETTGENANYSTALYTGESASMLNNKVYSSYDEFTLLYQNLTNGDYYTFSWESTKISLSLTNLSATATFVSWQYYNWHDREWQDISYSYEDQTLGTTSDGRYVVVDCYETSFDLDLIALYTCPYGSSTVYMPYAVSATQENNLQTTPQAVRPLLLRPNLYQSVTIEIAQCLYAEDLANEDPEQTTMPENLVRPSVDTSTIRHTTSADRSTTNGRKGKYEYGTVISLINNTDDPGADIKVGDNTRYRFLGWFIKYNKVLYYIKDSEFEASLDPQLRLNLICQSDKQNTQMSFIAIYVRQYRQSVNSYNLSGSSTGTMESALTGGGYSADASPELTITTKINSAQSNPAGISFKYLDVGFSTTASGSDTYGTIDFYNLSNTMAKYYYVNSTTEKEQRTDASGKKHDIQRKRVNVDGEFFTDTGREMTYYFDVGCRYYVDMPDSASYGEVTYDDVKTSHATGFCADTDTLFTYIKNKESATTKRVIADFSSYYNSGKGTYYDGYNCVTAAAMKNLVYDNESICHVLNDTEDTQRSNVYDLAYVSTVTLIFYNLTYKGGVSVPSALAKLLTGGVSNTLTVWDEDPTYGDFNTINAAGTQLGYGANGEVVIRVSLVQYSTALRTYIGIINRGFQGTFQFAFAGMQVGEGFDMPSELKGPSNNGLFAPGSDTANTFTRWYEVDLSKHETSTFKTYLFGKSSYSNTNFNANKIGRHTATNVKYSTQNVGDPKNGYYVTTVEQFKAIDLFWKNNKYSCVGVTVPSLFRYIDENGVIAKGDNIWKGQDRERGEYTDNYANYYGKTKFVLTSGAVYNMQGLTLTGKRANPIGTAPEWTPICNNQSKTGNERNIYGTNLYPDVYYGFDGILDGQNAIIEGVAALDNDANWFGLFASVSGGEILNLVVDNTFIYADAVYAGVLAGHCEYATISNVTFRKVTNLALYSDASYASTISAGDRSLVYATQGAGLLAGYMMDSTISNINVYVSTGGGAYGIEIIGNSSGGAVVGEFCGDRGWAYNINLYGDTNGSSNNGWLIVKTMQNAGGLFGHVFGGALVENVSVDERANMALGYSNVRSVGGVVGKLSESTLSCTTFNGLIGSGADTFNYNQDDNLIGGKGIFLFAKTSSVSSDALESGSDYGYVGLLVGTNASGVVNNCANGAYYTVRGIVKAHAGTIGGIVGLNTGRVTGFSLVTGYSSSYGGLTVLARLKYDSTSPQSYNVGGVVGANLGTGKKDDLNVHPNASPYNGIVDDITVTGVTNVSDSDTNWVQSGAYAFVDGGSSSTKFTSTTYRSISTGKAGDPITMNGEQTYYVFHLNLGGIVGYSRGSIVNCGTRDNKVTFNVQANGNPNATNNSFYSGKGDKYTWSVLAGMIAGYFDPSVAATAGVRTMFELVENRESTPITDELLTQLFKKKEFLAGRIQSCYATNCYVVVVGRCFMDSSKMGNNTSGKQTYKTGVGIAGIAGGSGANASGDFSINSCAVTNVKLVYNVTPAGKANDTYWNHYIKERKLDWVGAKKEKVYHVECRNVFYQVELRMRPIVAGLFATKDKNDSFFYTQTGVSVRYVAGGDDKTESWWHRSTESSGWFSGSNGNYPDITTDRVTRYQMSNNDVTPNSEIPGYEGSGGPSSTLVNTSVSPIDQNGAMFKMAGKVVKTDMTTGFLLYTQFASYCIKYGDSPKTPTSVYIGTYTYKDTTWSFYLAEMYNAGYDSPNLDRLVVRGQA